MYWATSLNYYKLDNRQYLSLSGDFYTAKGFNRLADG